MTQPMSSNHKTNPAGRTGSGYIQPHALEELWFHTGTECNLGCSFCLEGAGPGVHRIETVTVGDIEPFVDEALTLGVKSFAFTGGEPFMNPNIMSMLTCTLKHRPTMVLTNGLRPLRNHLKRLNEFLSLPHPLKFRVSLDYHQPERHDRERGDGSFRMALDSLSELHRMGFATSVARHLTADENAAQVAAAYQTHLTAAGLPSATNIVAFPELHRPNAEVETPRITENCMTTYKDERSRAEFMCAFSKMVVKIDGRMRVYACTLVDDDTAFDMGGTLAESMKARVLLTHHRCFSCFSQGTSCAER